MVIRLHLRTLEGIVVRLLISSMFMQLAQNQTRWSTRYAGGNTGCTGIACMGVYDSIVARHSIINVNIHHSSKRTFSQRDVFILPTNWSDELSCSTQTLEVGIMIW